MLRKITEFVDRDVAANSRPISMIGAAIPFVPFMMFVDGAPFDKYPVLGGLALAVSVAWVLFVLWRGFRHVRAKLEGDGYVIGSFRFWRLIIGTVLLLSLITVVIMWLENKLG